MTTATSPVHHRGGNRPPSMERILRRSLLALALLMLLPSVASASSDGTPSLDQYLESVPTTRSDRAPRKAPRVAGADSVRSQITEQGGSDAQALESIVDSPALGAPPARRQQRGQDGRAPATASATPSAIHAFGSTASGGGGGGPWLLGGLLLIAAAAVAARVALRGRAPR